MAIFIKFDGIDGDVSSTSSSSSSSGANGGVWKTTNFLTSASPNVVYLSSLALRDSPLLFDMIDARDADAGGKARRLFDAAYGSGAPGVAELSVSKYNKFSSLNNIRQMSLNGGQVPVGRLYVGTEQGVFSNVLEISLFGATFSNLAVNTGGGETVFALSLNFAQVKCRDIPPKK